MIYGERPKLTKFYPITPSHVNIMKITLNDNTKSETCKVISYFQNRLKNPPPLLSSFLTSLSGDLDFSFFVETDSDFATVFSPSFLAEISTDFCSFFWDFSVESFSTVEAFSVSFFCSSTLVMSFDNSDCFWGIVSSDGFVLMILSGFIVESDMVDVFLESMGFASFSLFCS